MSEPKEIVVKGAREHNLKGIDVRIPRNKMVVITGLSGSGKSSLAFDTIYAEGQRRYVESLSSYARQFLGLMEKPDCDNITGLSPAISINQKSVSKNPRSTVGTITEIYDYLRLLYSRTGIPHCPKCGKKIHTMTKTEIFDIVMGKEGKIRFLAPIVSGRKGEYRRELTEAKRKGFLNAVIDGKEWELREVIPYLDKNKKHYIDLVVDELEIKDYNKDRIFEAVETALVLSDGKIKLEFPGKKQETYSEHFGCLSCNISFGELEPRIFSFNSPHGACPECGGLGKIMELDPDLIIPDTEKSLSEGAVVVPGFKKGKYFISKLKNLASKYGFSVYKPVKELSKKHLNLILYGTDEKMKFNIKGKNSEYSYTGSFEGVIRRIKRLWEETDSGRSRQSYERFMRKMTCPECKGARLSKVPLSVRIEGKNIAEFCELPLHHALEFINGVSFTGAKKIIAKDILKEIKNRLKFLNNVGLSYLTLGRESGTLSGGEAQRIRLASQIGSQLAGVLYVLDEPTIGLHQRDNLRLIKTLQNLRDLGNTLLIVEHDRKTMEESDWIIDLGPGAGRYGGEIVAEGTYKDLQENPKSITGKYLSGSLRIRPPKIRREWSREIELKGVKHHNLKNIDVSFPLGVFACVTGVSGSGKSSLVTETLVPALKNILYHSKKRPGEHREIRGVKNIDKVAVIDQSPIGRTPRSNPATYTGVFDYIRGVFARTKEARLMGYKPGRFSFNVSGGRCENCKGRGLLEIEMNFLPDVYVKCDVCGGTRYNHKTLDVNYKGKNIAEVLDMTVDDAADFFRTNPAIRRQLGILQSVGLGYIKLGQSSVTLSGGEAQRVKLASELGKRSTGKTLYVLDEPTTGLHFEDIKKLLQVLYMLVDKGNTVLVIEHNLDVIKCADWIIDLGPEGGENGGEVVFTGTPDEIINEKSSYTGKHLEEKIRGQ